MTLRRMFNLPEPHLRMGIPILRDLLLGSGGSHRECGFVRHKNQCLSGLLSPPRAQGCLSTTGTRSVNLPPAHAHGLQVFWNLPLLLSCPCPCPCPCLAFGPVGPLGEGRPRGVLLPLPFCTTPLLHPTPRLCCPGCSWTEGTQGCRTPRGYKEAQREHGCCPPATPTWPKGVTWQSLVAKMALRGDRAGRLGNKASPSPSCSAHGGPLP